MARALPYRARPPPPIAALVDEAPYSRLFVLAEPGPTSFVLRGETPRRFKVSIGETHSCSCHSGNELCIHILFVLMRVFRTPAANPLIWQLSLTEREIAELMRGRVHVHTRPPPRAPAVAAEVDPGGQSGVERKELGTDPCPICYDDMLDGQEITYCKSACGNNVHTKCMKMWADNRVANGEEVTCPMCRTGWGVPDWLGTTGVRTRRERFDGLAVHHGITCRSCSTMNFAGTRYKCMICNNYDLCAECFTAGSAHRQHPFVSRDGIDSEWVAAERSNGNDASNSDAALTGGNSGSNATPGTGVVSVDLLTKLPTKSVTEDECGRGRCGCGVCGDAFRPGQVARTIPCGCCFHQRCIDRRLMEQMDVCPNGAAGRGTEACMTPITAETIQVQLETARALAVAAARRRGNGNRRRRPPAQEGVRANANGALDFSLGGVSISTSGNAVLPESSASAGDEPSVDQRSIEDPSAVDLQRKRAALAALERQRISLQAQHDAASAEESHLAGELGGLLASQPILGVTGASSDPASTILGSASPVDAALVAEAERRNHQGEGRARLGAGHRSRNIRARTSRPATVGEGDATVGEGNATDGRTVRSGALVAHSSSSGADTTPDLVLDTVRSRTAPTPSTGDAAGADTSDGNGGRGRGSRGRSLRRRGGPSLGRRGPTSLRQPMDPTPARSRSGLPASEESGQESPAAGWQDMFIGTASTASPCANEHGASLAPAAAASSSRFNARNLSGADPVQGHSGQGLYIGAAGDAGAGVDHSTGGARRNPPPATRRRSGRLLPRGSLRAARTGSTVADERSQSPRGTTGVGHAATAAALAEAQDAAQRREAEAIAEVERQRLAAAEEARASRVARDQRRRAALARAAENRAVEAEREEARAEAKRQSQARIAARATAHREEQVAAEASRRSAREAALEARSALAAW